MNDAANVLDLPIEGMHCSGCVKKVTAALDAVPGVSAARVELTPPHAALETSGPVSLDDVRAALAGVGGYRLGPVAAPAKPDIAMPEMAKPETAKPAPAPAQTEAPVGESLYPLGLIIAYIAGAVALIAFASGDHAAKSLADNFMAGFFLVFSFFKLLDLKGFASAYGEYDLVAKAAPAWSFAYPFVELALGVAYLLRIAPTAVNSVTLALMVVGAAGVLRALLDKRKIRCACLGAALNLPMTTVTLVEDLSMAAMAGAMLAIA